MSSTGPVQVGRPYALAPSDNFYPIPRRFCPVPGRVFRTEVVRLVEIGHPAIVGAQIPLPRTQDKLDIPVVCVSIRRYVYLGHKQFPDVPSKSHSDPLWTITDED